MAAQSTYSVANDGTGYILTSAAVLPVNRGDIYSLGGWVRGNSGRCYLVGQFDPVSSRFINVIFNSGVLNSSNDAASSASGWTCDLSDGGWHHLLIVAPSGWVAGTDFKLYIDGNLATPTASNDGFNGSNNGTVLGGRGSGAFGYVGSLDDWFFCASDVSSHAAAIAGTPGVAGSSTFDVSTLTNSLLWRLEAGTGTSATDSSGNGHTGTFTGGMTWNALNDVPLPLQAGGGGAAAIPNRVVNINQAVTAALY